MSIDFHPADYAPTLAGYTGQGPFRFWCQKVLPIVYDDSLSYYELLNKVVAYLNNVISDVATVEENIAEINDSFLDLQEYVNRNIDEITSVVNVFTDYINEYFDNLDVQNEINNKLNSMAEDGSLTSLLSPIVALTAPDIITDWLDEHITPTSPAIDSSLTVSGAGADAKVTGDNIRKLDYEISAYNSNSILNKLNDQTRAGITLTNVPGGYNITGTATEATRFLLIGTSSAPYPVTADSIQVVFSGVNVALRITFYSVETVIKTITLKCSTILPIPDECNGLTADLYIANGSNVNESVYPAIMLNYTNKELTRKVYELNDRKLDGYENLEVLTPDEQHENAYWNGSEYVEIESAYGYYAAKYYVEPNKKVYLTGVNTSVVILLFRVYNDDGVLIDSSLNYIESQTGKVEYIYTMPVEGSYIIVNSAHLYTNNSASEVDYVTSAKEFITILESGAISNKVNGFPLGGSTLMTPTETVEGIFRPTGVVTNANYWHKKYSVSAGDIVRVYGANSSATNALWFALDENNQMIAKTPAIVATKTTQTDAFVVPENCATIVVNIYKTYGGGAWVINKNIDPYNYDDNIEIWVGDTGRVNIYDGAYRFVLGQIGANNLFNFIQGYFNNVSLFQTSTDWLGPYRFSKDGTTDGDLDEPITTGGNHDVVSGGVHYTTAICENIRVYVDGKLATNGGYKGRVIEFEWTNKVMAWNTFKYDGTGEYCIEEHYRVRYKGSGVFEVEQYFIPLANCHLRWYSGLQFAGSSFADKFFIPAYSDSVLELSDINQVSAVNVIVDRYTAIGALVSLDMEIDRTWSLASKTVERQVTGDGNKTYMIIQSYDGDTRALIANNRYGWRGKYKFYPTA